MSSDEIDAVAKTLKNIHGVPLDDAREDLDKFVNKYEVPIGEAAASVARKHEELEPSPEPTDGLDRLADAVELQNAILFQIVLQQHVENQRHPDESRTPRSLATDLIDRHGELYGFEISDDSDPDVAEEVR